MTGYEKVSFLKFEAAGESWYVTEWFNSSGGPEHSWVAVVKVGEPSNSGYVCVHSGRWISGGFEMYPKEKAAIVDYLRANPLPGDGE